MWFTSPCCTTPSGFLELDDLVTDQGEINLVFEFDPTSPDDIICTSYSFLSPLPSTSDVTLCYYDACNPDTSTFTFASATTSTHATAVSTHTSTSPCNLPFNTFAATKKKYKPVALKTCPTRYLNHQFLY